MFALCFIHFCSLFLYFTSLQKKIICIFVPLVIARRKNNCKGMSGCFGCCSGKKHDTLPWQWKLLAAVLVVGQQPEEPHDRPPEQQCGADRGHIETDHVPNSHKPQATDNNSQHSGHHPYGCGQCEGWGGWSVGWLDKADNSKQCLNVNTRCHCSQPILNAFCGVWLCLESHTNVLPTTYSMSMYCILPTKWTIKYSITSRLFTLKYTAKYPRVHFAPYRQW